MEGRFRAIVENASDVVTLIDENAVIIYVTPAAERVLGYTSAEMEGRSAFEFIHAEDQPRAVERLRALVERPAEIVGAEVRLRRKDGTWMWSESVGRNLLDDPAVGAIIATHRDVTERKRFEEALAASERRFRALIEASADGVMLVDEEGRARYMGPPVKRLLGYEPDELIGRSAFEFVHRDDLDRISGLFRALVEDPRLTPTAEMRVRHADGSSRWVEAAARNLLADEAVGAIVVNFRDVTERKDVEDRLRRSDSERRELLGRLVRAQEEERHRIALDIHDDTLQTLTALGMRIGMLKGVVDEPEQRRRLGEVEQTLARTMQGLRALLFQLRPPALDEQGIEVALGLFLEDQKRNFGLEYGLEVDLDEEPPPAVRVTLYRISQEALANVVRHARASRVGVRVRSSAGGVETEISDDGVGFESSPDDGALVPGHLGLPAMRERAEFVGGWIRIESAPGGGTTVRFWLPLDRDDQGPGSVR